MSFFPFNEVGDGKAENHRNQKGDVCRVLLHRDYNGGIKTHFDVEMPEELQSAGVGKTEFDNTINKLNEMFAEMEEYGFWTCMESFAHCLTFYTLFNCMDSQYKRGQKRILHFISTENRDVYAARGVEILNPWRNGLLYIVFLLPEVDPLETA